MDTKKVKQLLEKYIEGETNLEEEQNLRNYFRGEDLPEELKRYADPFHDFEKAREVAPADDFDVMAKINFDGPKDSRKPKERTTKASTAEINWPLRMAAGFLLLLAGFGAGYYMNAGTGPTPPLPTGKQNQQVRQMRAALVGRDIDQQASAGRRLSAVDISQEITGKNKSLDRQITDILSYTMNNDNSVNVRVAAAEALFKFRRQARIRRALIDGLSKQAEPIMQITLITMLVKMKAKEAIPDMQRLLVDSGTREVVRDQLKAGIGQLQT